ncbi:MAG TPA: hypothetical protein VHZ77_07975 [Gaiellaceae bacterium]|nr:hypothetical protein [Gaiellaceae bacterium]
MSSEVERRLEAMLAAAPEPDPGAGEEALHRALQALRPEAPPRRGLRTAALAFAAAVVLLVIAAGSLGAAGALHVSFGTKAKQRPPRVQLMLPSAANGIAAVVDGRLSVVTKGGFRLQGLPVSTAALSPHALNIAAGIGNSLVAMRPNGRQAWSHPAGGRVVAIAWAPDGLRIAYVVHAGRHFVLHVIYGNGIHDTTIDRSVRAVQPSWRADNLAFAYVGGGGRAVVYDLGHKRHTVMGEATPVTHVAFAPTGTTLAVATATSVRVGSKVVPAGKVQTLGWLNGRLAVAVRGGITVLTANATSHAAYPVHDFVAAITPKLVIVRNGARVFTGHTTLLTVPRDAAVQDVQLG